MDIDLLSKMVKELILDKDEVLLPGLGTFVAERVNASFSDKGYTINPPYRRLSFRQKNVEGDNSLIDFYSRTNNVDFDSASIVIGSFLKELKEILQVKKTVVFPGLGKLRATKENNFFFISDEELEIYPSGFGLESVSLKTHQETDEEVSQAVSELWNIASGADDEAVEVVDDIDSVAEKDVTDEPSTDDVVVGSAVGGVVIETSANAMESESDLENVAVEPTDDVVSEVSPETGSQPRRGRIFLWIFVGLLVTAVLLLLLFWAVSLTAPQLIDSILYSPEDLQFLHQYNM